MRTPIDEKRVSGLPVLDEAVASALGQSVPDQPRDFQAIY